MCYWKFCLKETDLFGINEMLLMLMYDGARDLTDGGALVDAVHV